MSSHTRPGSRPAAAHARDDLPLYVPLDRVLVRAPLLPIEHYRTLGDGAGYAETQGDAGAGSPTGDPGSLAPRDPRIRQALAVGSMTLLEALERASPGSRGADRLLGKLLRYVIRMSTRPTPYGLFAGVALAQWGPSTDLSLSSAPPRKRTRPDMAWLLDLVLHLEMQQDVRSHLRLLANPMAVTRGDRLILMERAASAQSEPQSSVSVRATGAVGRAMAAAREPVPYADLAAHLLATTPGATPARVEQLLEELVLQTVLLTDLRPPLTTDSPARYVAERLAAIPAAAPAAVLLDSVLKAAAAWDEIPLDDGRGTWAYRDLVRLATNGAPAVPDPPAQVDLALTLAGRSINEAVGREVARAAELLLRLSPSPHGPAHLSAYRRAFIARYGPEREVPLLDLLDPAVGLGDPAAYGRGRAAVPPAGAAVRSQALLDLAYGALNDRAMVVDLDAETLARLETCDPATVAVPASLDIYAHVAAASYAALDAGDFTIIIGPNVGAQAAGRNLGRFAHLLGAEATETLLLAAAAEEHAAPGRLWAELVYVPHKHRSANVMIRPAVRAHEIPFGAVAGVPPERTVPLNELVVGVRHDRFYVHWPAAAREVAACTGHMLNYASAPVPFRFLFDVGRDGLAHLGHFDWGPASRFPFLPRVRLGRIVLRPAQWRIDAAARERELPAEPAGDFLPALQRWRVRWRVPRHIQLGVADNRLLLDLDDPRQADQLRAEIRGLQDAAAIVLYEALPQLDQVWMEGPGGRFMTELVVPLVLRGGMPRTPPSQGRAASPSIRPMPAGRTPVPAAIRLQPPGSAWLFVKLYGPRALEDDLVGGPLRLFAEDAVSSGMAQEWFFVRYADPDAHIRVRFHGDPPVLVNRLLPAICAWGAELMATERCARFAFDTYDREVERYGGPEGIALAEAIFSADSAAAVRLLDLVRRHSVAFDRLTLAILSVDDFLAGLGLSEAARLRFYAAASTARQETGAEYRERKSQLRSLLDRPGDLQAHPRGAAIGEILAARRAALVPLARQLASLEDGGMLSPPAAVLHRSYVHMHCNRLLGVDAGQERRVLGLLARTREGLAHHRARGG